MGLSARRCFLLVDLSFFQSFFLSFFIYFCHRLACCFHSSFVVIVRTYVYVYIRTRIHMCIRPLQCKKTRHRVRQERDWMQLSHPSDPAQLCAELLMEMDVTLKLAVGRLAIYPSIHPPLTN
eukprot:GHVU01118883.1.p2 GENE.GHVU01118883.1~~GHVU01118883.1.p2  ORF type:complete len:122 (+),score=5.12 GHVU01118883.1:185-550(+)